MTDTSSVFICTILLFIFYYLNKSTNVFKNLISIKRKKLIYLLPFFIVLLTFSLQFYYNKNYSSSLCQQLNKIVNTRLYLNKIAMERYDIQLLGQPIQWNTHTINNTSDLPYFYVDSSYIQISLQYGLLMLIFLCWIFAYILKMSIMKKDSYLFMAVFVFLLHCVFDPQLFSFRYDPFLILCLSAINYCKERKDLIINEKN